MVVIASRRDSDDALYLTVFYFTISFSTCSTLEEGKKPYDVGIDRYDMHSLVCLVHT